MRTETIDNKGRQYLKAGLEIVTQKGKSFYLAKIKANDFLDIYTVRPAEYDLGKHVAMAQSFPDEADYYRHLINEIQTTNSKDFQREASKERVNDVIEFIETQEYAFFPNTIIANCELINDWEEYEIDSSRPMDDYFNLVHRPPFLSFHQQIGEQHYLYIPKIENAVLVIDGQHRLAGLKNASDVVKADYDLIIAFIIGFDRSVIAKQFYTVNFEQKPVNKSLLYQLTGEFSKDIDEISFLHNAIKLLNELEDSPFFGRVKMLGVTPRNLDPASKAILSVSQAFLLENMMRFISAQAKGTIYPPIFLNYYREPTNHINIIRIVARYFTAVRRIKPDWDTPATSVISKGMGVGALLKVLNLLLPLIFLQKDNNWQLINNLRASDYIPYLDGLADVDFSSEGPYGKSGSGGTMNKIKDDIIVNLRYWGNFDSFDQFLQNYKSDLIRFSTLIT